MSTRSGLNLLARLDESAPGLVLRRPRALRGRRASSLVIALGLAVIAILIAVYGLNKIVLDDTEALGVEKDYSATFWVTAAVFAWSAVAWALVASRATRSRVVWWSMAALNALLAIEAVAQVHVLIEEEVGGRKSLVIIWPAVAIAVVVLIGYAIRRLRGRGRTLLTLAVVSLLGSQLAASLNAIALPAAAFQVLAVLEEALEVMTAFLLVATACEAAGTWARGSARTEDPPRVRPLTQGPA